MNYCGYAGIINVVTLFQILCPYITAAFQERLLNIHLFGGVVNNSDMPGLIQAYAWTQINSRVNWSTGIEALYKQFQGLLSCLYICPYIVLQLAGLCCAITEISD